MAAQTVTKVPYVDNETVIGAANLNAIQDAVNNHASLIDGLDTNKVDKVAGKGLSTNDYNNDAQSKLNNLPSGPELDTSLGGKVDKRTSGTEVYTHTGSTQGGATLTETPTTGAVPLYGTGGVLKAAAPVAANDVVRKAELDEVVDEMSDSTTGLGSKAPAIIETVGPAAIASFVDGADGMPIKKLVANIEPVQDLHGYNNPWPAGGWKNLIDDSKLYVATDTTVYIGAESNAYTVALLAGTYTISVDFSGELYGMYCREANDTANRNIRSTGSNVTEITFTIEEDGVFRFWVYRNADAGGVDPTKIIHVQLEKGSTATDYAPYSNICPISGWTGTEISRTGKNLLNSNTLRQGDYNGASPSIRVSQSVEDRARVMAGVTYTYSLRNPNYTNFWLYISDEQNNLIQTIAISGTITALTTTTFTPTVDGLLTPVFGKYEDNSWKAISIADVQASQLMLELGSIATAYEQYQGSQLSVTFPSSAGTVYGGTLDLVSRVLTVTHGYMSALWSTGRDETTSDTIVRRRFPLSVYSATGDLRADSKSNIAPYINGSTMERMHYQIMSGGNGVFFFLPVGTAEDTEVALYYRLAEPVTYQLTASQITGILTTLHGNNNIWADTGDVTADYPADTKLYIDNHITQAIANALNA